MRADRPFEPHPRSLAVNSDGFGLGAVWRLADPADLAAVRAYNATEIDGYACYFTGVGQMDRASFWIFLFILIVTAVAQLKYLNDALSLFSISSVIPIQCASPRHRRPFGSTHAGRQAPPLSILMGACLQVCLLHDV